MTNPLPRVLIEYIGFLESSTKTNRKTITAYTYDMVLFLRFMKKRFYSISNIVFDEIDITDMDIKFLSQVSIVDMIAFMNFLTSERHNGEYAIARKISSLKSFYDYLVNKKRYLDQNPTDQLETPKITQKNIQELKLSDVEELLRGIKGKNQLRDQAIVLLLTYTSLKASEIVELKLCHLDLSHNQLIIEIGKNEVKMISLKKDCIKRIQEYTNNERPKSDSDFLFLSQRKSQMSVRTIQHMIKTHGDQNPNIKMRVYSQGIRSSSTTNTSNFV